MMLLIGFTWIFIAMAVGLVTPYVFRGPWAEHGPAAMFAASVGAFLGGSVGAAISAGPVGYTSTSEMPTALGLIFSVVGGVLAFAMYAADARRQARVRADREVRPHA